jgi:hypothetical protein
MHRRCLTSFSVFKGWDHYIKVRYRDINVEASSRRSYFGLNALFFAARSARARAFAGGGAGDLPLGCAPLSSSCPPL